MKWKTKRLKLILAAALAGGVATQFGGCSTALLNGALASFDFCAILGPDCRLGPIAPCGATTCTTDAECQAARLDDLLLDCPPPTLVQ